jgi:phage antirepressor YoqD-like protein
MEQRRKQTSLETANQMYKDAFFIKKTRFSHEHPELSNEELTKLTVDYFRKLNAEKDQNDRSS